MTPPSSLRRTLATLICVYRGDDAALFSAALESIFNQDLDSSRFESRVYLGIDGELRPELEQAVCEWSPRCHVIHRNASNQGLARTLNALLQRLQGEVFVFRMDADDWSLPERYRLQLEHMDAHPAIDIVGTAIVEIDESKGHTREVHFARGPQDALARMHQRVPLAHPTACIRRRVFEAIPAYPVQGSNEDVAFWFECVRHGFSFDNLPQALLRYRLSSAFWQRRGLGKARSELMCYWRGIHAMHGIFTLKYLYPFARFALRVMPSAISRWAYDQPRLRGRNAG